MKKIILLVLIVQTLTVKAQLNSVDLLDGSGTVTGTYNSITDAYNSILTPLAQAYIVEIKSTYNGSTELFPIVLSAKSGASAATTITIRPDSGISQLTIISSQGGESVIMFDDADFVILDGRAAGAGASVLTIENSGTTSNTNTIEMANGATNNIIRFCTIENRTTTLSGRGVAILGTTNASGNTDNTIEFCKFASGRYKINSNGGANGIPNSRLKIYGCEILDIIFVGIWGQANHGTMYIDSNFIHSTGPTGGGPYGILFDSQSDSVYIRGNHIYELDNGTLGSDVIGISIRSTSALRPGYTQIANNMIAMTSVNQSSKPIIGVEYRGGNPVRSDIFFNTIYVSGVLGNTSATTVESACLLKAASDDSASAFNIRNNIFVNERTGGIAGSQHPAIAIEDTNKIATLNENTYNSITSLYAVWDTQAFTDLSLYKAHVGPVRESQTNNEPVDFISPTDLHLGTSSQGKILLACTPIAGIDFDFDHQFRGGMPYRGADEDSILLTNVTHPHSVSYPFVLFPNPSTGKIFLKTDNVKGDNIHVSVYTIDGKIIYEENITPSFSFIEIEKIFSGGYYFLKLNVSETVKKFVIVD